MGVLDDAIREHLELKRRHGAEEEELRRQAEEALGPARREVAPAQSEDGDGAEAAHADEPQLSETIPPEALHSDVHDEEAVAELPEEPAGAEATAPEAVPHEEAQDEHLELGDTPQHGFEAVEEHEGFGERVEGHERVARVEEYERAEDDELPPDDELPDGDDELAPAGDDDFDDLEDDDGHTEDDEEYGAAEDVLEDTPDFLQETPEHDRLWFEQKPPRDFDFD